MMGWLAVPLRGGEGGGSLTLALRDSCSMRSSSGEKVMPLMRRYDLLISVTCHHHNDRSSRPQQEGGSVAERWVGGWGVVALMVGGGAAPRVRRRSR